MTVNILITGANSGIGYATAKILASESNHHIILGCRDSRKGEVAKQDLQKDSSAALSISSLVLDVNDASSIESAARVVARDHGKLDVLINNAGIYNPTKELEAQLTSSFQTNVVGSALTTEAFKTLLSKSRSPYVLHIGSTLGSLALTADSDRPDRNLRCIGYRTSKAALGMLTIEHAKELGPLGIKVFLVCPGLVESNLRGPDNNARTAGGKAQSPETSARFVKDVICGKRDRDVGLFVHQDGIWPW